MSGYEAGTDFDLFSCIIMTYAKEERQQILEVLFPAIIYRKVEEALKDVADQTKAEVERIEEKKKEI